MRCTDCGASLLGSSFPTWRNGSIEDVCETCWNRPGIVVVTECSQCGIRRPCGYSASDSVWICRNAAECEQRIADQEQREIWRTMFEVEVLGVENDDQDAVDAAYERAELEASSPEYQRFLKALRG